MEELINKIQAVRNTLEGFDIVSKRDTMMKLLGCQQVLDEVLAAMREPVKIEMEVPDGNDQAE